MRAGRKQPLYEPEPIEPGRIVSLAVEDQIDFMREPRNVFDDIPLRQVCRDDTCGIEEVHRRHRPQRSRLVPCPECLAIGHLDSVLCVLCMGRGMVPRAVLRLLEKKSGRP
jgi:hypothetical protein